MNFTDSIISKFSNYYSTAEDITLGEMLRRLENGFYKDQVENFRKEIGALQPFTPEWDKKKRALKAKLPTFTPMCQIKEGLTRSDANIAQMHAIVCHDLDAKDQPDAEAFCRTFKAKAAQLSYIAFIGESVSKMGYFTISLFDSTDPRRDYKRAFDKIQADFAAMGFVTDKAASSLSNHRFVSYDPQPYLNLQAQPLPLPLLEYNAEEARTFQQPRYMGVQPARLSSVQGSGVGAFSAETTAASQSRSLAASQSRSLAASKLQTPEDPYAKVERILREGNVAGLSDDYQDWYEVGFAFADTFGEAGRQLFHLYSATSQKYNAAKADRKYSSLLRSTRHTHTLNTFYHVCKKYGISAQ